MLDEVLSEFSQPVLPLLCNSTSVGVASLLHHTKIPQMKTKLLLNFCELTTRNFGQRIGHLQD